LFRALPLALLVQFHGATKIRKFVAEEGHIMKKTMLALVLIASVVGLSACAKYPSVVQSGQPTPAAASAQPR
jgi:uncharacterized lipoprotein YajG